MVLQINNIILIGFMGTGKTTIGKQVATQLNLNFIDTDQQIVQVSGMEIPKIFSEKGESYFRALENQVFQDVLNQSNQVISTGGGLVIEACNRQLLHRQRENGDLVIWLTASLNTLWHRLKKDDDRPLLKGENPREKINNLVQERDELYREVADYIIDTSEQAPNRVIAEVIELYNKGGS